VTVIEIRPDRRGWKVFEAPGVEPLFQKRSEPLRSVASLSTPHGRSSCTLGVIVTACELLGERAPAVFLYCAGITCHAKASYPWNLEPIRKTLSRVTGNERKI
jgi:hypothetical protein